MNLPNSNIIKSIIIIMSNLSKFLYEIKIKVLPNKKKNI